MDGLITAILLGPLFSAALILLFFRRNGETAAKLSVGSAGLSLILSLAAIFGEAEGVSEGLQEAEVG